MSVKFIATFDSRFDFAVNRPQTDKPIDQVQQKKVPNKKGVLILHFMIYYCFEHNSSDDRLFEFVEKSLWERLANIIHFFTSKHFPKIRNYQNIFKIVFFFNLSRKNAWVN